MLTADLVHARRQKNELKLTKLNAAKRTRAMQIATEVHTIAQAHIDRTREDLIQAWKGISHAPREKKLVDGLRKLVDDGLVFEMHGDLDPPALRKRVFELAAARRQALADDETFEREVLLEEVASEMEIGLEDVEKALFGDLRSAHILKRIESPEPKTLVQNYDLEQARAVLLKAVRVHVKIQRAQPAAMRQLFRKLKFLRLLHRIHRGDHGAWDIEIDGPFSLFESVTKYGLQLALALPAISACGHWHLEADLRWGKERKPLHFRLSGEPRKHHEAVPERLPEEVQKLLERFSTRKSKWQASISEEILELPGFGTCVPDLAFTHSETGEVIFLEVMGFWSRDAVWRRVELVQAGLAERVIFALSKRLRVSESVLSDELPSALYVYKGTINPKEIETRLTALAER